MILLNHNKERKKRYERIFAIVTQGASFMGTDINMTQGGVDAVNSESYKRNEK